MNKKLFWIIFFLILFIGIILRVYKISEYPVNLSHDDISQLYDSISVLSTGKDIYGEKLPFIFKSIGDYKPPFYIYATIPFIYLFGQGESVIRIVGLVFGILIIPAVYIFTAKLLLSRHIALVASFFTAIAPFEIHYSRKSFEGQAGVFILLVGFYFLLDYLRNRKQVNSFIVGSLILGSGLYVYFSYAILIPLFYLAFLSILLIKKIPIPKIGILTFILVAIPLIAFIIKDPNYNNRINAVSLTKDSVLSQIITNNAGDYPLKKDLIVFRYALVRYIDQLNPTFLFLNGLDLTNQDPFDIGPFYIFQLPLIIFGLIYLFKYFGKKKEIIIFIFILISLGLLPSGLSFEKHSPHRILIALTVLDIISAAGLYFLIKSVDGKVKNIQIRLFLGLVSIIFIIWNLSYFAFTYMISYPIDKSEFSQYPFKEIGQIAGKNYNDYDQILFDPRFGKDMPWTGAAAEYYLAYYGNYPVEKMQNEYKVTNNTESEKTFGKYVIKEVYWPRDKKLKNTLVIASPWVISRDSFGNAELIKEVKSYQGTSTAFYVLSLK